MTTTADPLAEAKAERDKIYQRLKEARAAVAEAEDPGERMAQTRRLKILRGMYRDACDRCERLRPAREKKRRTPRRDAFGSGTQWDFFERSKVCWSDIEGYTWNTLGKLQEEADANQGRLLNLLMARSAAALTQRQRQLLSRHVRDGLSMRKIAEEEGINQGTVSRVIRGGLRRMEQSVVAALVAIECVDGEEFDAMRWAELSGALTERQREFLYYLLTDQVTMAMIADHLQVNKSTVSRSNERIVGRIVRAGPELPGKRPKRTARRGEWCCRSEEEVAAQLGISPWTFYQHICRNKPVGDIPRSAYECLARRHLTAEAAAGELGCRPETVRKYWTRYAGTDISTLPAPAPYHPAKRPKQAVDLRRLLSGAARGEGTIGAAVSAETYQKMLRVSGAERSV